MPMLVRRALGAALTWILVCFLPLFGFLGIMIGVESAIFNESLSSALVVTTIFGAIAVASILLYVEFRIEETFAVWENATLETAIRFLGLLVVGDTIMFVSASCIIRLSP